MRTNKRFRQPLLCFGLEFAAGDPCCASASCSLRFGKLSDDNTLHVADTGFGGTEKAQVLDRRDMNNQGSYNVQRMFRNSHFT